MTAPAAHSHVVDSAYMVDVSSKLSVSKVGIQVLGRSSFRGAWNVVLDVSAIGIGNQAFHWSLSFYVYPCSLFFKKNICINDCKSQLFSFLSGTVDEEN